jgi:hypothetical protein
MGRLSDSTDGDGKISEEAQHGPVWAGRVTSGSTGSVGPDRYLCRGGPPPRTGQDQSVGSVPLRGSSSPSSA